MATQNNKKTNNKKQNEQIKQSRYTREFVGIFCIVFAIILFIGLFLPHEEGSGAIGSVGLALTTFAKTVAGTGAIAFPIFLLLFGFFLIIDRKKGLLQKRVLGVFLLFFSILGFLHLNEQLIGFRDYTIAGAHGTGGGFFGSVLDYILLSAFGKIGAMIILVAMSLIAFILLTNVMLRDFFSKLGVAVKTSYDKTKTVLDEHNEKTAAYQQAEKNEAPVKILPPIISHEDNNKPFIPLVKNEAAAPADAPPPPTGFSREYLPTVSGASAEKAQNEQDLTEQPAAANDLIKATRAAGKTSSKDVPSAQQGQSYILPTTSLLTQNIRIQNSRLNKAIAESVTVLEDTLDSFGIKAHVTQVVDGPAITRYELQPAPGVKVSKITGLTDDIALALAATDVRIEAPIPGKSVVGIEVPRAEVTTVHFRDVIEREEFTSSESLISFALGKNIGGDCIIGNLASMPHLLIAGATGSGKSICLNSIICSFLFKAKPDELKLILIDPKKVEMSNYSGLPHLITPVVTDNKKAAGCLKWAVLEMENRYSLFAANAVKDFKSYNSVNPDKPLPQIVVIIDELADLMMVAPADVENAICRLAQMARAAGIHLIVATQRPSVNVITGLIKANIPSRIAFAVTSSIDSRTILDMGGAEKLLGRGDMLYHPSGAAKPIRVQGTFIDEKDIQRLVKYCCEQAQPKYFGEEVFNVAINEKSEGTNSDCDEDPLLYEAGQIIITTGQASTSFLQRRLRIGNPRAGRLMDILEAHGVVGPPEGAKPRTILMTMEQFNERFTNR